MLMASYMSMILKVDNHFMSEYAHFLTNEICNQNSLQATVKERQTKAK